jgi:hypothetical protein
MSDDAFRGYGMNGIQPLGLQAWFELGKFKLSYFLKGSLGFKYGLAIFNHRNSSKVTKQTLSTMLNTYPIRDGQKQMGVISLEKNDNMRGMYVVGDPEDLASFWCDLVKGRSGIAQSSFNKEAILWTGYGKGGIVPYLDFDEVCLTRDDFSDVWKSRINPAFESIYKSFQSCVANDDPEARMSKILWLFNVRDLDEVVSDDEKKKAPPRVKISVHVHFLDYYVEMLDLEHMKNLICNTPTQRKNVWGWKEGKFCVIDQKGSICDAAPYGGEQQLFRGPWCGKLSDSTSHLRPGFVEDEKGSCKIVYFEDLNDEQTKNIILGSRIRKAKNNESKILNFSACRSIVSESHLSSRKRPREDNDICENGAANHVVSFFAPLLMEILMAFQAYKNKIRSLIQNTRGFVPIDNLEILTDKESPESPYIRFIQLKNDSFCLTDSPNHFHSDAEGRVVVNIHINYIDCTIWHYCFACSQKSEILHFLQADNQIETLPLSQCRLRRQEYINPCANPPHSFILRYFQKDIVHNKTTNTIYIFDASRAVWCRDSAGNYVLGKMIEEANNSYNRYMNERLSANGEVEKQRLYNEWKESDEGVAGSPADEERQRKKFSKEEDNRGKKLMKTCACLIKLTIDQRAQLTKHLLHYSADIVVDSMHPNKHLVPMSDGRMLNVFTGSVGTIKKEDLVTSLRNAELTDNEEELAIIDKWFTDVCSGCSAKKRYLMIIAGYMLTLLQHDRKFYVLKGCGKNGKGLFKEFLVLISSGAHFTEPSYKAFNQSFIAEKGNSNQNPEAASPETYGLLNCNLYYIDDIMDVNLDTAKLKRIVAGESLSGRQLHGSPCVIKPEGKLLVSTNVDVSLPGRDNACWERYEEISFDSKWVQSATLVDPSRYVYLEDKQHYEFLLTKLNAFFTLVMRALREHYSSLNFNAAGQPLNLTPFPTTPAMILNKSEARARAFALASFVQDYTEETDQPLFMARAQELFDHYLTFLENRNEQKLRKETTLVSFCKALTASMEIRVLNGVVEGRRVSRVPEKKNARQDFF